MASLFDDLPRRIAHLEAKFGSGHPYVVKLKAQLAAGPRAPSAVQTYRFQAVQHLAPDPAEAVMACADARRAAGVAAGDGT